MHMHTRSLQSCLIKSRRACKTEATSHISLQREQEGCAGSTLAAPSCAMSRARPAPEARAEIPSRDPSQSL